MIENQIEKVTKYQKCYTNSQLSISKFKIKHKIRLNFTIKVKFIIRMIGDQPQILITRNYIKILRISIKQAQWSQLLLLVV